MDYEPQPLCIQACREVQEVLARREDWQEEIARGKMFGVLIVENVKTDADNPKWGYPAADSEAPKWGYLAAYSGQIGGRSDWEDFVPAVFDYLQPDGYFKTHEAEISRINQSISHLEKDERMKEARTLIRQLQEERKRTIVAYQEKMKEAKAKRDSRREAGNLSEAEEAEMIRESQFMKAELRRLKKSLSEKTAQETEFEDYQENILRLKQLRKQLSDALQQWLFSQFRMLNQEGESKDLLEIFRDEAMKEYPQAAIATSRIAALKMVPPQPGAASAANRNCCNMPTSMVTNRCRWLCSGGEKARRRKSVTTCSSIQPATASASRYCIGCCLLQPSNRNPSTYQYIIRWKHFMRIEKLRSSISPKVCCLFRGKTLPNHQSMR